MPDKKVLTVLTDERSSNLVGSSPDERRCERLRLKVGANARDDDRRDTRSKTDFMVSV